MLISNCLLWLLGFLNWLCFQDGGGGIFYAYAPLKLCSHNKSFSSHCRVKLCLYLLFAGISPYSSQCFRKIWGYSIPTLALLSRPRSWSHQEKHKCIFSLDISRKMVIPKKAMFCHTAFERAGQLFSSGFSVLVSPGTTESKWFHGIRLSQDYVTRSGSQASSF